jgi:hypothetical protein
VYDEKVTCQLKSGLLRAENVDFELNIELLEFGLKKKEKPSAN